jgi:hypothetical protein
MLVLDNGFPMSNVGGGANINPLSTMQSSAVMFVNLFANGRDHVGLVTFTGAPWVADAPLQTFLPQVPTDINAMGVNIHGSLYGAGSGGPNTSAALEAAYQQLQKLGNTGALNVIVLFTDGVPTGFSGNFGSFLASGQNLCTPGTQVNGVLWALYDGSGLGQGLTDPTAQSENDDPASRAAPACPGGDTLRPATLLTGMPSVDLFNSSTNGSYEPVALSSVTPANIIAASKNALDAAATTIRTDTTLKPVIFVISLKGNPGLQPDDNLLAKIANDPNSSYYQSGQTSGQYIPAPSTAQLQSAFTSIASQVLRLAAFN